jgi:hypothetical protein
MKLRRWGHEIYQNDRRDLIIKKMGLKKSKLPLGGAQELKFNFLSPAAGYFKSSRTTT